MSIIQRVYQAHELNYSNLLIVGIVCASAPALQWLLIKHLGLGYLGAAWAASAYNCAYPLLQVPHLVWSGHGYLCAYRLVSTSQNLLRLIITLYCITSHCLASHYHARSHQEIASATTAAVVPTRQALSASGLCEFARLMLPGFIMCVMEWWVLEAVVFLSGRLHDPTLTVGAFTITSQVSSRCI